MHIEQEQTIKGPTLLEMEGVFCKNHTHVFEFMLMKEQHVYMCKMEVTGGDDSKCGGLVLQWQLHLILFLLS